MNFYYGNMAPKHLNILSVAGLLFQTSLISMMMTVQTRLFLLREELQVLFFYSFYSFFIFN